MYRNAGEGLAKKDGRKNRRTDEKNGRTGGIKEKKEISTDREKLPVIDVTPKSQKTACEANPATGGGVAIYGVN